MTGEIDCMEEADISDSSSSSEEDSASFTNQSTSSLYTIKKLQSQIMHNVYDYDSHVKLINALRNINDFRSTRAARQSMNKVFPLTETFWLEWIDDEIEYLESDTDDDNSEIILSLFEKAVSEYLCPDVWLKYCDFLIKYNTEESNSEVKQVLERGISSIGMHPTKSAELWKIYRNFEISILEAKNIDPRENKDAANVLISLFKRQLANPFIGMSEVFVEFQNFCSNCNITIDDHWRKGYEQTLHKLSNIQPFELQLNISNKFALFEDYINYELKAKTNFSRLSILFERLVAAHSVNCQAWLIYLNFLITQLKNIAHALRISKRSLQNCPWESVLWEYNILLLEAGGKPQSEIAAAVQEAMAAMYGQDTLNILLTYLSFCSRCVSKDESSINEFHSAFAECLKQAKTFSIDPCFRINVFAAEVEATRCNNLEKARSIWEDVLKQCRYSAAYVIECAQFELRNGSKDFCRKLYHRAFKQNLDDLTTLVQSYLQFEKIHGNGEENLNAYIKCRELLRKMQSKITDSSSTSEQTSQNQADKNLPRKHKSDDAVFKVPTAPVPSKKPKFNQEEQISDTPHEDLAPRQEMDDIRNLEEVFKPENAVFISNLAFSTNEDDVSSHLSKCGFVKKVSFVKNRKGTSRGFGAVFFDSADAVQAALKMDRDLLKGRPMFISKYKKLKQGPEPFRFHTGMEKNKVFIKGLDFKTTAEDLENEFKKFGELQAVRLVSYKSGQSKGLAFVEFKEEADAAKAVLALDNKTLHGKAISVAISNPPPRKNAQPKSDPVIPVGVRGKSRTQLDLLPRSIKKTDDDKIDSAPKSNSDFKKLLLK